MKSQRVQKETPQSYTKTKKNNHAWAFCKASELRAKRRKKKSPYDQFLGATQRTADSHKTVIRGMCAKNSDC